MIVPKVGRGAIVAVVDSRTIVAYQDNVNHIDALMHLSSIDILKKIVKII